MISYFESEINKVLKHIPSNTTQLNEQYFCDSNRKIYLIGRNEQAKELIGKITVNGIIDDFTQDVIWSGISIYKLSDINVPSIFVNCSTSISSYDVYEKIKTLNSLHKVFNVYDLIASTSSLITKPWFVSQQRSEVESNLDWWSKLYSTLADEASRKTLLDVVSFRLTANIFHMKDYTVRINEQYMEKFMEYSNEIFVDAGGFDGDTTDEFVKNYPNYKMIYFYEPSECNMQKAKKRLSGVDNIHFKPLGLSDNNESLFFNSNAGSASAVTSDCATDRINVVALDNDLKGVSVSFIKMDLEGWEVKALKGAEEIISRNKPKLAVAVYHDAKDFREISKYLLNLNPEYKIYIRHYTQGQ